MVMDKKTVFLFSGQGSQYFNMYLELFRQDKDFNNLVCELDGLFHEISGKSVVDYVYNPSKKKFESFDDIIFSHLSLLILQYALAKTIMDKGVYPDILVGLSLGEYVALALSEVITVRDAIELVSFQAGLIKENCRNGFMLAILKNTDICEKLSLHDMCEIALENCSGHFVVSGEKSRLNEIFSILQKNEISYQVLPVSYAFHSALLDVVSEDFKMFLKHIEIKKSKIKIFSSISGKYISSIKPGYLWDIARSKIRFKDTIGVLEKDDPLHYIDLSPTGTLHNFVKYNLNNKSQSCISSFNALYSKHKPYHCVDTFLEKINTTIYKNNYSETKKTKKMQVYIFPGQGSQKIGMGKELFPKYKEIIRTANEILGYSVEDLCLHDKKKQLNKTEFTQPLLYLVNALYFMETQEKKIVPDFVAGHSLGEYNALLAAGAFDFGTGLRLVQKRGEIMAKVTGGGMAAIVGLDEGMIRRILSDNGFDGIDLANFNSPTQIVIAGKAEDISKAKPVFEANGAKLYSILRVSGAFHSRYMKPAQQEFSEFINGFSFDKLSIPVISNATAREYGHETVAANLISQLASPVRWHESICYILGKGHVEFEEVGPGKTQTNLIKNIQAEFTKPEEDAEKRASPKIPDRKVNHAEIIPENLGDKNFKKEYNLKYPYITGSMYKGIASKELVIKMAKSGLMGFFGAGGVSLNKIEEDIKAIRSALSNGEPFGVNILYHPEDPIYEEKLVDLFIGQNVTKVEVSAFMQITPSLIRYKAQGIEKDNGTANTKNKIIAKVSRPEIAEQFMSPAPAKIIQGLLDQDKIDATQAELLKKIPVADDICVEADSGGHTDRGVASVLMPAMLKLRDDMMSKYNYAKKICIGAAGGISTPQSMASAFILGADFVVTGSVNQCTVEAATSDLVKDLLQQMNIQDTDYAPAGDMFELGAKVQVLKKGLFFAARANKLYELYKHYDSLNSINLKTRQQIQDKYFNRTFEEVYSDVKDFFSEVDPSQIEKAEKNEKHKMALIFRWYFNYATELALNGISDQKVNFQIHCGSSLGAFNQYVKGSVLEDWRNRHVDIIANKLLNDTVAYLNSRYSKFHA